MSLLIINKDFLIIGSQLPHQHSVVIVSSNENDPDKLYSVNSEDNLEVNSHDSDMTS